MEKGIKTERSSPEVGGVAEPQAEGVSVLSHSVLQFEVTSLLLMVG